MYSVGQVPFNSKVTGRREHLPVAVLLLVSQGPFDDTLAYPSSYTLGRDTGFFRYGQVCLEGSGRLTEACAGNDMFRSQQGVSTYYLC